MHRLILLSSVVLASVLPALRPGAAWAGEARSLNVIYFGNSFTENSVPWFHPTLAGSAKWRMKVETHLGPGWQIWMHVDAMLKNPAGARKSLVEGDWDAVVIQHFGAHPMLRNNVRRSVFHNQQPFPEPRDVSDLASASAIIDMFLARNAERKRVFIYNSWPAMPGMDEFTRRVREESEKSLLEQGLAREEVLKRVKERKPTLEEMLPLMRSFDYAAAWLAEYERNDDVPWASKGFHSRQYAWKLMDELKARYPQLAREGRLSLIPHGDVLLALDKKIRAGLMPGVENVGFFWRDGGHLRAGLPRYTLAATCLAVMLGERPHAFDHAIYAKLENYRNENLPVRGYVHQPDLGELLEITPARAALVNDTIWEVIADHPHTNVRAGR